MEPEWIAGVHEELAAEAEAGGEVVVVCVEVGEELVGGGEDGGEGVGCGLCGGGGGEGGG